jgi:hypothetical protein
LSKGGPRGFDKRCAELVEGLSPHEVMPLGFDRLSPHEVMPLGFDMRCAELVEGLSPHDRKRKDDDDVDTFRIY